MNIRRDRVSRVCKRVRGIDRRRFLGCLVGAGLCLPLSVLKRRLANAASASEFSVALGELSIPWSVVEVEFTKEIETHRGPKPSTFPGYIMRLPDALGQRLGLQHGLYAISRICPHEGCPINLYKEQSEVPYPIEVAEFPNPMLVCTCHQSVFDPAQGGKVLSGPAPRPPWSFYLVIENGKVLIKDLEPGGEKWG